LVVVSFRRTNIQLTGVSGGLKARKMALESVFRFSVRVVARRYGWPFCRKFALKSKQCLIFLAYALQLI
jgi:hypothetical protein